MRACTLAQATAYASTSYERVVPPRLDLAISGDFGLSDGETGGVTPGFSTPTPWHANTFGSQGFHRNACSTGVQTVEIELATQIYGLVIRISAVHPDVLSPLFPYLRFTRLSP